MKPEGEFVYLTADEMAEYERSTIEDFGIDELLLMENAGAAVASTARQMLHGSVKGRKISFLVGKGNNGGDGLVAARHLHNWGAQVTLVLGGGREDLRAIPAKQLAILEKMGVGLSGADATMAEAELLVDSLLGYNARGDPKEPLASLIRRANSSKIRILAVDVPSGLDATTGKPGNPCVMADTTLTLGLPKTGFLNPESRRYVGSLHVADISFPNLVYRKFAQETVVFGESTVVKVW